MMARGTAAGRVAAIVRFQLTLCALARSSQAVTGHQDAQFCGSRSLRARVVVPSVKNWNLADSH